MFGIPRLIDHVYFANLSGCLALVMEDHLIKLFARHQLLRKGDQLAFDEINQIRQKLRFLGRLLYALHQKTSTTLSFQQLLRPEFYDAFVESVLGIRKENKQVAFTLGHYIKKLCLLNIAEAIKSKNPVMKSRTQEFFDLYNGMWSETVSSSTVRMQQKAKLNQVVLLPELPDLKCLTAFVDEEIRKEMAAETIDYTRLLKLLLATLVLFNKRRPAEVANLTEDEYKLSFHNQEDRDEIIATLSPEEKAVSGRYGSN